MKKLFFSIVSIVFCGYAGFSQVKLPQVGEKFKFENSTTIPTSFDLTNADGKPYNFSYVSNSNEALNINLIKSKDEIKFGMGHDEAKNATINFFNDDILVGSIPASEFPEYQTNIHPGIIIAIVVVACCVEVRHSTTTTTVKGGKTTTTTTFTVAWDCDCLSISFKNGQPPKPKVTFNGKELEFNKFTITNNSIFNANDYSLIISH